MFKNYFKTAWRHLLKNKFYSFLNIAGLSIGLAVGILILLWVQDERSFDNFHRKASRIYRLENWGGTGTSKQIWTVTVAPITTLAKKEIPEIEEVVRVTSNNTYTLFKYGNNTFVEENSVFTDPSLFSVFDFPLIKGNPAVPFPDEHSVVLTTSVASRYFGKDDPMGKIILANDSVPFRVSGIVADMPKNSFLRSGLFLPMSLLHRDMYGNKTGLNETNDFHQFQYVSFVLLRPGTSPQALPPKLFNIHIRNKPDDTDVEYLLQPLAKMHLYNADGTNRGIETVRMFMLIAVLILAIACINYVNLSTARSLLRSKEVSLRKIVGAARFQLFIQFMTETAVLFVLAALLSMALMSLLMPAFNHLSGKELVLDFTNIHIWKVMLLTIAGTLVASSIYPAVLLSSFEPIRAMKGKIAARLSDALFRKILVVTQFAFSVILIAGTLVVSRQLHYMRSKELGYDKSQVFSFSMRNMSSRYDAVKASLLQQPGVLAVTRSSDNIISLDGQTGNNDWDGKGANETLILHPNAIDRDFIPFFKMTLVEGSNFTGTDADSLHFILNETAVKAIRLKNPIGKRFRLWQHTGIISGVVKDFHFASMRQKIEPAVFFYAPQANSRIYVKTTGKDASKAIAAAAREWKQYNAGFPFSYAFLDETFSSMYRSEEQTGELFNVFAAVAILISCLGLFGLAAYTVQVRTREIGVRKVLGASVPSIISLLAKDFIKLVVLAIVVAVPLAWYIMHKWLQNFAYKIQIGWAIFAIAGLAAICIALFTISFQSVKSALANPVKSLRTE
jgi:putative ABC transport system permease protein